MYENYIYSLHTCQEPHCYLLIQRVFKFFSEDFPVNSPDLINEKWIIMDGISSNTLFQAFSKCLS